MDRAALEKELSRGRLKPVYLFHGLDVFLKERYAARLAATVAPDLAELNVEHLVAEETGPGEVIAKAQSLPFLAERRVITLRGVDRYTADELSGFVPYLQRPNESTCLVLLADKPDFRLGAFKTLKDRDWVVSFEPPKGRQLLQWIEEAARERGQAIHPTAARELVELVGVDLMDLDQELEKACLFAGPGRTVGVDEVRAAARRSRAATVFDLGDAVGEQDPERALAALRDLCLTEHPLAILARFAYHLEVLLKARALMDQGAGDRDLLAAFKRGPLKTANLPPFVVKKYASQARRLDAGRLTRGLARLMEADLALKSSGGPERMVLERLVLDLASLRPETGSGS
jgi:DNA polymerase-3 subunit delta